MRVTRSEPSRGTSVDGSIGSDSPFVPVLKTLALHGLTSRHQQEAKGCKDVANRSYRGARTGVACACGSRWQGITRLEISYQADTDAKRGAQNRGERFGHMQRKRTRAAFTALIVTRASSKATLPVNPTVPTRHLRAFHALVAAKIRHIDTFYRRGNAAGAVSCCLLRDRATTAMCLKLLLHVMMSGPPHGLITDVG